MLSIRVLPRHGVVLGAGLSTLETMTVVVAAHTWAGGELPGLVWMAATAVLVLAAGAVVLRHPVPLRAAVPALALAQLLLHCWMVTLAPVPAGAHAHGTHLELTWQMVLAHAVGAAVTAVVWELRRRAVDVVLAWSDAGLVPLPARRRAPARRAPVALRRHRVVVVPLRGPPADLFPA